ncbi:hypothetical protein ACRALDRAFT_207262 [Sodiomyces alcalophilus JCM 7366]|uniref:uncharacterized protein n=1 Tax=Sodiomyces alcalophilus JCM 7366 TaxID=591952 RepID=UPI0039B52FFE
MGREPSHVKQQYLEYNDRHLDRDDLSIERRCKGEDVREKRSMRLRVAVLATFFFASMYVYVQRTYNVQKILAFLLRIRTFDNPEGISHSGHMAEPVPSVMIFMIFLSRMIHSSPKGPPFSLAHCADGYWSPASSIHFDRRFRTDAQARTPDRPSRSDREYRNAGSSSLAFRQWSPALVNGLTISELYSLFSQLDEYVSIRKSELLYEVGTCILDTNLGRYVTEMNYLARYNVLYQAWHLLNSPKPMAIACRIDMKRLLCIFLMICDALLSSTHVYNPPITLTASCASEVPLFDIFSGGRVEMKLHFGELWDQ